MSAPAHESQRPTFRLLSASGLHAPGFMRWLQVVNRSDPKLARKLLADAWPGIHAGAAEAALGGRYALDGETVVIDS